MRLLSMMIFISSMMILSFLQKDYYISAIYFIKYRVE